MTGTAMLAIFLAAGARSEVKEPEGSLLQSKPATARVHEILVLKPIAGHHFEPKAKQRCDGEKPFDLTARAFRCQLARPGEAEVTASVCDDAKSYCVPETFKVAVAGEAPDAGPKHQAPKSALKKVPEGFESDPTKALKKAKKQDVPLLVFFGAIWCPPCNMLDEAAFPSAEFRQAAARVVPVALDADAESSFDWKTRFKIGGYPTLVLADKELRELGRVVGYRSGPELAKWLAETSAVTEPVEAALARAKTDTAARKRVGLWRFERAEYAEAAELLKGLTDAQAHRYELLALKAQAKKDDDKVGLLSALGYLIVGYPEDVEFAPWIAELMEFDPGFAKSRLDAARANVESWARSPKLASTGWTASDLYSTLADIFEEAGRKDDAKAAFARAAAECEALAKGSKLPVARGANLERAYYLWRSGQVREARALYETLVAAYPDEFTFTHGYAKMLAELGEDEKAYELARRAEAGAYGDNWLRAVQLKAKLELASGRKDQARATVESALAQAAPPKSVDVRTHRYLAQLRELLAKTR